MRSATFILATGLAAACVSVGAGDRTARPGVNETGGDNGARAEPQTKKERERERKLSEARMELEIAEIECAQSLLEAEHALSDKRVKLEQERGELAHFEANAGPAQLEEDAIGSERSAQRADEARDELQQLESMYAEEEFAELTKELVIKRGRRKAELAERELQLERAKSEALRGHELPRKRQVLEEAVQKAERELAEAEVNLRKVRLANELKLEKARYKLEEAERPEGDDA